jgi:hypothetical protein
MPPVLPVSRWRCRPNSGRPRSCHRARTTGATIWMGVRQRGWSGTVQRGLALVLEAVSRITDPLRAVHGRSPGSTRNLGALGRGGFAWE